MNGIKVSLKSYLIEITAEVLAKVDDLTGKPLVDIILDEAGQKGTGKWTSQTAFDLAAPTNTINAAVVSRNISALRNERLQTSQFFTSPVAKPIAEPAQFIKTMEAALYTAKILSYAQGFGMLRMASQEFGYNLDMQSIASIWRAGCIIRAELLGDIMAAYDKDPQLVNLLHDQAFIKKINEGIQALRDIVVMGVELGIPVYAFSASLAYFDAYRAVNLPTNLTQGQRDYFGAHTYKRVDRDGIFHTDWFG